MIVPRLFGGLGNQMFQISSAYAYADRYNQEFAINYSLSTCPNQGKSSENYRKFFSKIPETSLIPRKVYRESSYHYSEIPYMNEDVLMEGYFQSEKYFSDRLDQVKSLFSFSENVKSEVDNFISRFRKTVGVHVRRGDFLRFSDIHLVCNADYFVRASKHIDKSYQSIVCSDDWDYLKNEMKFSNAVFSPFREDLYDMYLLSRCDVLVLSNSSFSWWASFLGKDKEKVIAPSTWFVGNGPRDYQDIFRKDWMLI